MTGIMQDQTFVHRAHPTSLTAMVVDGQFVGATVAAQCTGRIGWDYKRETHRFMEMYRGQDDNLAQRICDEHNAEYHAVVGSTPEGQKNA